MLMKAIYISNTFPTVSVAIHGHDIGESKATMDMGWIPALYFVAIKCRIHRVRLQAIKLLESTRPLHKEGIWDADIATCVARKVMEIEEGSFYKDMHVDDDFEFSSPPGERDFLLPVLPDAYRVTEVQVLLPDDPQGKVVLSCRRRQDSGDLVVLMNEYDMVSQLWINRKEVRE
jgi:hypothetical protein